MDDVNVDDTAKGDEEEEEATESPTSQLPPNLREISSLASWTVSSSKPGCSVPQLRSPDMQQFWQSDGPQPHQLNIHFFKQVSIVHMRLFLDFDGDESYTPTRILFLAGTGFNDLQEWSEMKLEQPRGWIDVDFSDVGREEAVSDTEELGKDDHGDASDSASSSSSRRRNGSRKNIPVLRVFLVQVKIMENHQNGKDTHLRGVQIFARDRSRRQEDPAIRLKTETKSRGIVSATKSKPRRKLPMPDWAMVPDLR